MEQRETNSSSLFLSLSLSLFYTANILFKSIILVIIIFSALSLKYVLRNTYKWATCVACWMKPMIDFLIVPSATRLRCKFDKTLNLLLKCNCGKMELLVK